LGHKGPDYEGLGAVGAGGPEPRYQSINQSINPERFDEVMMFKNDYNTSDEILTILFIVPRLCGCIICGLFHIQLSF
jgi:hypothetical protein